jgi:hypothetical protein
MLLFTEVQEVTWPLRSHLINTACTLYLRMLTYSGACLRMLTYTVSLSSHKYILQHGFPTDNTPHVMHTSNHQSERTTHTHTHTHTQLRYDPHSTLTTCMHVQIQIHACGCTNTIARASSHDSHACIRLITSPCMHACTRPITSLRTALTLHSLHACRS